MEPESRWDTQEQRWYYRESLGYTSQRSFLFYIVANVGQDTNVRPLAVAYRQGHGWGPGRGTSAKGRARQATQDTLRLMDVLSEPTNRIAIQAELALAARWYQGDGFQEPERHEVPDQLQAELILNRHRQRETRHLQLQQQNIPEIAWISGMREFPFLSTCLWLGLAHGDTRLRDIHHQPLGTVFRENKLEYGMAVIDISDLNNLRYGIVGLHIMYMAYIKEPEWDPEESPDPVEDPIPVLEELTQPIRAVLSAQKFQTKFHVDDAKDEIGRLNKYRTVDITVLDCTWCPSLLSGLN